MILILKPPASNRGVRLVSVNLSGNKQVAYAIDWLRATVVTGIREQFELRERLQDIIPGEWAEAGPVPFSYRQGVECDAAGIFWNDEHPEFGIMLEMSGSRLSRARERGLNIVKIMSEIRSLGFTITRLDLAMDVYNVGVRPQSLYHAWMKGELTTKSRKVTIIKSVSGDEVAGETVYIGSRQSNAMLRVYDKGAEMKQDTDRIRLEWELKRECANAHAVSVINQGIPRTLAALFRDQITAGLPEWVQSACEVEFEVVRMEATKDTNFMRWFETTVLPSIEKAARIGFPDLDRLILEALKSGRDGHGG